MRQGRVNVRWQRPTYLLAIILIVIMIPTAAFAESSEESNAVTAEPAAETNDTSVSASGTCGDNLTWVLENETLTISGTGAMADYDWPTSAPWYSIRGDIFTVVITNGVTSIGEDAFDNCYGLTSVTIPNSVISIGRGAFNCCFNLTSITLSNSVISIGSQAFWWCEALASVTIPNSVTTIGNEAFALCDLTSITIPSSVNSIGAGAFSGCDNLSSMKVASGNSVYHSSGNCIIETASKALIAGCKSSVIPTDGSVTSIGEEAFFNCSNLTSITIPDSVTSIGYWAFYDCFSLTSITIPSSVTSIGEHAFSGCDSLASITIPKSITSIGEGAFSGCDNLTSMKVASGNSVYHSSGNCIIETASKTLIAGCKSSVIPADGSVTGIGGYAFSGCNSLTNINIPKSVTSIGDAAFSYCGSLTYVQIPSSVTSVGWRVFDDCDGLTTAGPIGGGYNIEFGWTKIIPEHAFSHNCGLTSIIIPDGVASIGGYAFDGCENLTYLQIPASVTSMGYDSSDDTYATVFSGCTGLTTAGPIGGGYNIEFGWTKTIPTCALAYNQNLTSVTLPTSVTSIGDWAFCYCDSLTSITIPKNVTSIGDCSFQGCESLASMKVASGNSVYHSSGNCIIETASKTLVAGCKSSVIPSDGSATSIGEGAFYDLSGLTHVVIPNSVKSIGKEAFGSCYNLTSVSIGSGVTSIGDNAFEYCSSLTGITIPENVVSIGELAFSYCGLTSITIPKSVTSIGAGVFGGCDSLSTMKVDSGNSVYHSKGNCIIKTGSKTLVAGCKSSVIPTDGSVTKIGERAFYDCDLTSITIPKSVTHIGDYALARCYGLSSITIPSNVTRIGKAAFWYCTGLTEVTIPNSVASIDDGAFQCCFSLTSVIIPGKVTTINNGTFAYCDNLTSVTIPASVTAIERGAFCDCDKLKNVYYGGSKSDWGKISIDTAKNDKLINAKLTYNVSVLSITTNPADATVTVGDTAKFTVIATGEDLTYQWQYRANEDAKWKNSGAASAKTDTFSIKGTEERDGYQYRCEIKDSKGNIMYSNVATLHVVNFSITKQPSSVTVDNGVTAKFTVSTSGDNLTYQWQYRTSETGKWKNSGAASATTNAFSVKGTKERDGYQYRCEIKDSKGNVAYSDVVTLHVVSCSIIQQPSSVTVANGVTAKFTVSTSGDGLTYQWQYRADKSAKWKDSGAASAKTNTFSIKGTTDRNGYQYRCKITDSNGTALYSDAATLYVATLIISKQPKDTTISIGATAKFNVTATGDGLTYQWQYRTSANGKWKNSGATSATTNAFSVKGATNRDGYQYRCKVTDSGSNVLYSDVVTLHVANFTIDKQPKDLTVSVGETAEFKVTTTGDVTYQWQYRTSATGKWKNSSATSATTNAFSVKGTAARNGYQYRCNITDSNGKSVYTKAVTLTVK